MLLHVELQPQWIQTVEMRAKSVFLPPAFFTKIPAKIGTLLNSILFTQILHTNDVTPTAQSGIEHRKVPCNLQWEVPPGAD